MTHPTKVGKHGPLKGGVYPAYGIEVDLGWEDEPPARDWYDEDRRKKGKPPVSDTNTNMDNLSIRQYRELNRIRQIEYQKYLKLGLKPRSDADLTPRPRKQVKVGETTKNETFPEDFRIAIEARAESRCEVCGLDYPHCHAHHIDDKGDHSMENGAWVCPNCHTLITRGREDLNDKLRALRAGGEPVPAQQAPVVVAAPATQWRQPAAPETFSVRPACDDVVHERSPVQTPPARTGGEGGRPDDPPADGRGSEVVPRPALEADRPSGPVSGRGKSLNLGRVPLTLVENQDDVNDLLSWLGERRDWLGVDSETSGLDLGRDRLRLIQVGDANHGWVLPVEQWGYGALAKHILTTYDRPIACQNACFDQGFFVRDGIGMPWSQIDDTMVMSHLHQSGYATGLKPVSKRSFGDEAIAGEWAMKEGMRKQGWDWGTVPVEFGPYWQYSAMDPVLTVRVAQMQSERVFPSYLHSYEIEMGAIPVFSQAQVTGMRVDVDHCRSESLRLEGEMATLAPQLPEGVNVESHPQLRKWLVASVGEERLTKKTKSGAWAVDAEALSEFYGELPEAQPTVEYLKRSKLKNTYFDNLIEMNVDGIVHPQIRVLGAEKTGRMSISAPALQTLPKSKVGRQAFLAREGHTLIAADFEGQEMRMLACLAHEERWLEEFAKGTDPHRWIAEMVYETDAVSKAMRQVAKAANFAKAYGAGVKKFSQTAGISFDDAEAFILRYDSLFPGVRRYQDEVADQVTATAGRKKWGYVHTWTGRKLMVEKEEAYKATNYSIQGGCAELTKLKVAELANAGLGDAFRLPIHDEVICEVPDDDVEDAVATIRDVMVEDQLFDIPFTVDVSTAKCWGDLYD